MEAPNDLQALKKYFAADSTQAWSEKTFELLAEATHYSLEEIGPLLMMVLLEISSGNHERPGKLAILKVVLLT